MEQDNVFYVGVDVSKAKHAVAIAEGGRGGEVRYFGEAFPARRHRNIVAVKPNRDGPVIVNKRHLAIVIVSPSDSFAIGIALAKAAAELDVESAIIDGEIVVLNETGLSDFGALRKAITRRRHDLYFVAFDLLHLNGHDLRDMALEDRREILAEMIPDGGRIQFSQALPGDAKAIFHLVDQAGLEGMVSKRKDSKYRSGNSTAWLKTKAYSIDEYELLGVEREAGKPAFALMAERGTDAMSARLSLP